MELVDQTGFPPGHGEGSPKLPPIPQDPDKQTEEQKRQLAANWEVIESVVRRDGASMLAVFRRLSGDADLAGEILSETGIKAACALHQFEDRGLGPQGLTKWMTTIGRNLIYDHFRIKARLEAALGRQVTGDQEEAMRKVASPLQLGSDTVQRVVTMGSLEELRAHIGSDFLDAFLACTVHGVTRQEYADFHGIPKSTVGTRVFRAHRKIDKIMQADPHLRETFNPVSSNSLD